MTIDVISYSGEINIQGYAAICEALKKKQSDRVILALCTPGGDPHAGFRIARALQHTYDGFDALIPRYCKSAGTLVAVGAQKLFLDDMSELGPLDIQIKKSDEIIGQNSGLDILQAVNYLQSQAMVAFRNYLVDLTKNAGLSTRVASDISTRLTTGLFEPIFAQIDPMKLAEMQRATEIAFAYGNRLNEKSKNLRAAGLAALVTSYPSHSFVIDRKEAKNIFINVQQPVDLLAELSSALHAEMETNTNSKTPAIKFYCISDLTKGISDETSSNSGASATSNAPSEREIGRDSQDQPAQAGPIPGTPEAGGDIDADDEKPAA